MAAFGSFACVTRYTFSRRLFRLIAAEDSPNSKPMAYVVGSVSGSVSLYSLEQHANPDNIFG